jgi:hypothetical protein
MRKGSRKGPLSTEYGLNATYVGGFMRLAGDLLHRRSLMLTRATSVI